MKVQIIKEFYNDYYYTYLDGELFHCSETIPWERICRRLGVEIENYTLREHVEGHDGWDYKNKFGCVDKGDLDCR